MWVHVVYIISFQYFKDSIPKGYTIFLCNLKICGPPRKEEVHFLFADEKSEFSIYAICSSCFTSFCSQDQVLETELLGHIIISYENVPHWDPEQQSPLVLTSQV